MSACKKAQWCQLTMYLFSFASFAQYNIIALSDTVGELTYSFVVYSINGQPSAHPIALSCEVAVWNHIAF